MIKLRMTFWAFILLTFMSFIPAHAMKVIQGGKNLPLELNLLINYIQQANPKNFDLILPSIIQIDTYTQALSKEDAFLVGKVEIYKTLLKNTGSAIKIPVDGNTIAILRMALSKTNDNFLKWFLLALLKDTQDLLANPLYKEFLLQKNNNLKIETLNYRKLEKKGELLQFWISKISPTADNFPENINRFLMPKLFEALNNVQKSFTFMANEVSLGPLPKISTNPKELKFFNVAEIKAPIFPTNDPRPNTEKTLEEILGKITEDPPANPPADLPKPSLDRWLEEVNAPASLQNLPKPSNDADWLQDF